MLGDLERRLREAWVALPGWLIGRTRYQKRAIVVACDLTVLAFAVWLSFALRYGFSFRPDDWRLSALMYAVPVIGVACFAEFGLYRLVTRYIGGRAFTRIAAALALSILIWALLIFMTGLTGTPRTSMFLYWMLGAGGTVLIRQVAARVLNRTGATVPVLGRDTTPVLIWGAGPLGFQLADALERSGRYRCHGFLDMNSNMWGQYVGQTKVFRPERLASLIERHDIKEVLLALGDVSRQERAAVVHQLRSHPVSVRTLPQLVDIATGRVAVSSLRAVEAEDLLGRDPVPPDPALLARCVTGKNVMVTGAGGSIGSELVRQIMRQSPRTLVLFEGSENALYEIGSEVALVIAALPESAPRPVIVTVLGSVLDADLVTRTIAAHAIHTIYHAAAYKHVPIVETNPVVGFRNNTFGTMTVAEAAERAGVERFVLISTDKAVRPSSLMGASKRLAEMVLQARADEANQRTIFTMVRFGNVLDSSGSVVRLFRKQIERGGPVTVTHPGMIRYFMSIPEAASLVMQAGAMASGGEVFVLDMGEPVKIDDLARSMVRLMGREVRDADNPHGDIEITYVGLRPGEKLREELLIGANTTGTEHPRIQRTMEPYLSLDKLQIVMGQLTTALEGNDAQVLQALLQRAVEGYHVGGPLSDDGRPATAEWHPGTRTVH